MVVSQGVASASSRIEPVFSQSMIQFLDVPPAFVSGQIRGESKVTIGAASQSLSIVQESMLLPLWARALESRRKNGMFHDADAERISDYFAVEIAELKFPDSVVLASNVRTLTFDRIVGCFLDEQIDPLIIELGCGMSTRYERLEKPCCQWIDVDFLSTIEMRRKFIGESKSRAMVAAEISDDTWLDSAAKTNSKAVLIVLEGVLFYLQEKAVKDLFLRLATAFDQCYVLFDAISPYWLDNYLKHPIERYASQFRWALESPFHLEAWDERIKIEYTLRWEDLPASARARLQIDDYDLDDKHYSISIARIASSLNFPGKGAIEYGT